MDEALIAALQNTGSYAELPKRAADRLVQLLAVLEAAKVALDTCSLVLRSIVSDGVRSPRFDSDSQQFAAAWRDLRDAVDNAEITP